MESLWKWRGKLKILGLDFETTGFDPKVDRIIEVGACLYDWDAQLPIQILSSFVYPEMPIPEEITKITGITNDLVVDYGRPEKEVCADLDYLIDAADYVMAHKADFDKGFFDAAANRGEFSSATLGKPWVCSMNDIKYPERITTRNLGYLAAEHGFVSPFRHRAVFDVLTMLKVASGYDLDAIIARSKEPLLFVQALVSFDEKEKAKELQFRWYAPGKVWWKDMKESDYLAMKDTCGFRTQLLSKAPE